MTTEILSNDDFQNGAFRVSKEGEITSDGIYANVPLVPLRNSPTALKLWDALFDVTKKDLRKPEMRGARLYCLAAVQPDLNAVPLLGISPFGYTNAPKERILDVLPKHQELLFHELEKSCPELVRLCAERIHADNTRGTGIDNDKKPVKTLDTAMFSKRELTGGDFRADFLAIDSMGIDSDGTTCTVPLFAISEGPVFEKVCEKMKIPKDRQNEIWLEAAMSVLPEAGKAEGISFESHNNLKLGDSHFLYLNVRPEHERLLFREAEKDYPELREQCRAENAKIEDYFRDVEEL